MAKQQIKKLQSEIEKARSEIHTDYYPISIGELANMYRENEIFIHPEFQRNFRWSIGQKSRFIESILLGIPIPSLFVAAREDSVWDVVDGVQRLSTLFEFMGILKDLGGQLLPPLTLTKTKFLDSLEGVVWNTDMQKLVSGDTQPLSLPQQLDIKRAKLDFKIMLRKSDESAKYELFQRLNTGGSFLSNQEIRNARLAGLCPDFLDWLNKMADTEDFKSCTSLAEKQLQERYDSELVLRFLALRGVLNVSEFRIKDVGDFLDSQIDNLYPNFDKWEKKETKIFQDTFLLLNNSIGADAFRRFSNGKYAGGFLISGFEAIAIGVGCNITKYKKKVSVHGV